ncbi:aminotransferase class V-fold PLP-dependent enzyme [Williamsia deligens]|uniref:Aminotransferase class V-fold PLP-dependent enzyme n=1 Tax=Williamsia deligens TaxID=321325 RepID=A0ABW3G4I5_9NOCA|nr:aminotransferase class V-fold PLP-dependent enzyme [Williamsia deligens]MCP2194297.1 Selenocysteine lyase/Cysteine desulfurase [Williamsia deligens]
MSLLAHSRPEVCAPRGDEYLADVLAGPAHAGYANLDHAASAPALDAVVAELAVALPEYASVHRGAGRLSQITTARYEDARATVADFVRARHDDSVVFTRNTTDSLNLLASVVPGDTVVLDVEHHANLLPWTRSGRRVVRCRDTLAETLAALEAELHRAPAALLAVTGASNVTGEVLPVRELADIAHAAGARILVDAAQLAPHRAISMAGLGIDHLVFSGHKLYAPFGCGVLVGRSDWLDAAEPYLLGGGASLDVAPDESVRWQTGPSRHEGGSPNVLGAVAIAAACRAITEFGFDRLGVHDHDLRTHLDAGLDAIPGVRRLTLFADDDLDRVGIAAFTVDGHSPREVAEHLADRGIGVRDGRFCAHPLMHRVGAPDGAVRASFGIGTHIEEIDRLLAALVELTA